MSTLNKQQLDHLKDLLDRRETDLRADVSRENGSRDSFVDVASEIPDPGDSSFADLSVDLDNAAISRDMIELRAIEAARNRMTEGTYGDCVDCGNEIPYARLEVQPMAERCAPCQEAFEKRHLDAGRGATL
ncbi:transcriptional regulator, TraR/DksA family [Noviherbaspirillum humi]|uniref:Transcriptional regulator, TraR/DksA family n=1 Tax=Noviherbaspirillum humi TaxID=1688639 RepID=A0A239D6H6_9BURK|nr:TraR/DksA family transcriptional regulator [Noviherbaspirillum humi]SNS27461.1 transcriptional regulator, TraR/DksA family [Noviherbaspirillum humi]